MALLFRDRVVSGSLGHDEHVSLSQHDCLVLHFDAELASQHQEQFILVLVAMPCQASLDLCDFHIRIVNFTHDTRRPVLGEVGRSFSQCNYRWHSTPQEAHSASLSWCQFYSTSHTPRPAELSHCASSTPAGKPHR